MLSVWLPLNGDLHNYGLSNITAINNGATVDNNGKIGKCYSFDGNDDFINLGNIGSYFDGSAFSICFWIFSLENKTRAAVFSSYGLSSTSNFFGLELNSSSNNYCNNNLRFDWLGSDTYSPDDFVTYNAWTHICVTYDGVNQIRMYKNGALIQTSTRVLNAIPVGNTYYLGRDSRTGSTAFNGKLNDFRIYDHCLSPRECKQVSAALVLHYPLAMPGGENLLKNSLTNFPGLWSGSGDGRTLTTQSSVSVPEWGCNDGLRVYGKSGASSALCLIINGLTHGLTVPSTSVSGQKYTPSIYIKNNHQNAIYIAFNGMCTGQTINQGEIKKVILNATGNGKQLQFTISASGANKEYDFTFWHPKIELGEVCTPWVPATTDSLYSTMGFNDGIEYDVSGYGHNGTRSGTLTCTSDTPRYNVSTSFKAGAGIFGHPNTTLSQFTIAFWGKHTVIGKMLFGSNSSSTNRNSDWYWYGDKSFKFPLGEFYYSHNAGSDTDLLNTWTHFAAIYNGEKLVIYRNGIYEGEKAFTGNVTLQDISIGRGLNSNYWEDGFVSDFRAYATALSADDVMALYHTPISLANNGTLFTQGEYVES